MAVIGWDVGGAHLKGACVEEGRILKVVQLPCTLWLGIEHLERAFADAEAQLGHAQAHAVTMTGELVDLFSDRKEGVRSLIDLVLSRYPVARFWAGEAGLLEGAAAAAQFGAVASANWLASVVFAARHLPAGLFVDIGSTTADIVPFVGGRSLHRGATDGERLAEAELVYTGATRTPLMAVARQVPFAGRLQGVMAEYFATIADVHRLRGVLPVGADLHETADRRGKAAAESAARIARMVGRDFTDAPVAAWRDLAEVFARHQLDQLRVAAHQVLSRGELESSAPLVGAGIGRFLVRDLAVALGRVYRDFAEIVDGPEAMREAASIAAPAAAVAWLAWSSA